MPDNNFITLTNNDVIYPLLISVHGETKKGKTFFGASFPNAVLIDFPPCKFGFGKLTFDPVAMSRTVGEGFRSLFNPIKMDGKAGWSPKIPGFDYNEQYKFVKSYQDFETALESARFFSETLDENDGKVWIVLDDSYRWRGLETQRWIDDAKMNPKKQRWPVKEQFGAITQNMQSVITKIQEFANVCIIHRMTNDFETGEPKAQIYPSGVDYLSDASLKICLEIRDGKPTHLIKVESNGHDKSWDNPDYCWEVINPSPVDVLMSLRIPRELW